jgi:hypothetical protein
MDNNPFISDCPKCRGPHETKELMAECLMDNNFPRCSEAAANEWVRSYAPKSIGVGR